MAGCAQMLQTPGAAKSLARTSVSCVLGLENPGPGETLSPGKEASSSYTF